jgi:hypothetical protein
VHDFTGEPASAVFADVVRRWEWGADESARFVAGVEVWPAEYHAIDLLVIHHTNTCNDDPDPRARMRAVYANHCTAKGWGDIGYHFVVDEAGTVYEGRVGSAVVRSSDDGRPLGVVGGHVLGFNRGSLGVALMGTLEDVVPTELAWKATVGLLAGLCAWHGIDPMGAVRPGVFPRCGFPPIVGHGDLADRTCPGSSLYAMLPDLRADVARAINLPVGTGLGVS